MELSNINGIVAATKEQLNMTAKSIVKMVVDGEVDPVAIAAQLKKVEKFSEAILKDEEFKNSLITELMKCDKSTKGYSNIEISHSYTSRYDYSNDPKWVELNKQIKEREAFLKGLPSTGMTEIDEGTGEFSRVYPPTKKSSDVIKATIK